MSEHIEAERGQVDFKFLGQDTESIIKVIGVGGGGGNAVNKMFKQGTVPGVTFLLCNTDQQVLDASPITSKITLGKEVTKGLGAGSNPALAREAAESSEAEIRDAITSDSTEMVFITAGMGGGTGTGASPVIGRIAMDAGRLTIGIVTIPFLWEGRNKISQALHGVRELRKNVDAILVINNARLQEVYGKMSARQAFAQADSTLSNAARSISDIINIVGEINLDFADVRRTLKDGGVAIISTGVSSGEDRLKKAIDMALSSPLINHNSIRNAKKILFNLYESPHSEITTDEFGAIEDFTSSLNMGFDCIWGWAVDPELEGDSIKITILASGFDYEQTEASILYAPGSEENREAEARKQEDDDLIRTYYGGLSGQIGKPRSVRPLVFELEELDDDEIIDIAEHTPALRRDLSKVEQIRKVKETLRQERAQKFETIRSDEPSEGSSEASLPLSGSDSSSNTIYFN